MNENEYNKKVLDTISPYLDDRPVNLTEVAKVAQGLTPQDLSKIIVLKNIEIQKRIPFSEVQYFLTQ